MRTVSPNGSFQMNIHKPEYYNALKDYNMNLKKGLFTDADYLFNNYVNDLYNLRKSYNKDDPLNLTAKLLLNSLYGRFAMKPITESKKFIEFDQFNKFAENNVISDYIEIDNDLLFVTFEDTKLLEREQKLCYEIWSCDSLC